MTALPVTTATNRIWTQSEVDAHLICFKNLHPRSTTQNPLDDIRLDGKIPNPLWPALMA